MVRAGRLSRRLLPLVLVALSFAAVGDEASIVAGRILRIGVGRNNPPFSCVEKGSVVGYYAELVKEAAALAGYEPVVVAGVWDAVKDGVIRGSLDVAAAMADLPERRGDFAFTMPVSTMVYALWARRESSVASMADLAGRSVVLQEGSAMADTRTLAEAGAVLCFVPDDADALVLLDSGLYDAAILPLAQGLYLERKMRLENARPLPGTLLSVGQCFAVRKGDEELARELDAGLQALGRSGRLDEIYSKWLGLYERPAIPPMPTWVVAGLALVGFLLVVSLSFVIALRRTVRARTAALESNERKYRVLAESLPQMIFLKDRDSTYLSCNRRYAEALGVRPGEIEGRTDYDFYPAELAEKYRADDRAVMESPEPISVVERWSGPGGETWINTVKAPIRDDEGAISGVIGIFWDVSERLRLEEETKRRLREKEILLQEINHRVKNNLQIINAILRLELDESTDPDLERFVKDTTARISAIATVHELLYSSDDLSDISVDEYLGHLAQGLRNSYARPGLEIAVDVDAGGIRLELSPMICLGLIANEMITNSMKYAFEERPSGRIALRLARAPGGEGFVFSYSDDGVGLPDDFEASGRRSLGMDFIESLAGQLGGELSMGGGEGGLGYELRFGRVGSSASPRR